MDAEFESQIPDDSWVVSVKIDLSHKTVPELTPEFMSNLPQLNAISEYICEYSDKIIATSAGLHLGGKARNPHIHYHFIVTGWMIYTNESIRRNRFLQRAHKQSPEYTFQHTSWQIKNLDITCPKWQTLAYPVKEGIIVPGTYYFKNRPMPESILLPLIQAGQAIYNAAVLVRDRNERSEERRKNALVELYEFCVQNREKFSTYKEMGTFLNREYLGKLELNELPDPKNFKVNCQKIGFKLGLCDFEI